MSGPDTETDPKRVLRLRREFDAPLEKVYDAFTNPAVMRRWWGPQTMQVYQCEVDLQPGGTWCVGLLTADGQQRNVSGTFTRVEQQAISFTWRWDYTGAPPTQTEVSIEFQRIGAARCAIVLQQQLFDSVDDCNNHQGGWHSSFLSLEGYLQQQGSAT